MTQVILNDFFAKIHHNDIISHNTDDFREIISVYDTLTVKKLHLSLEFDPSSSIALHIAGLRNIEKFLRKSLGSKVKISVISTVPLLPGISLMKGLSRLVFSRHDSQYIFLMIPAASDVDKIIHELHSIIYDHNFTPVLVGIEKTALSIPDRAMMSLYKIPNAIYQIDLPSLSSRAARELARMLILQGKTVIFGSGDSFDTCPYLNYNYYTKLLSRIVGSESLGYFTLRHNRVFP